MSKLWYPVAISVTIASCGGETNSGGAGPTSGGATHVDTGVPTQTGGRFVAYYGVALPTGGFKSTDTGTPSETGGMTPVPPYGVIPIAGGAPSASTATGGAYASGGKSSVDTGTPAATGGRYVIVIYGVIGIGSRR